MLKKTIVIIYFIFFNINMHANSYALTKEEVSYIKSKKVIKVANQLDWYPYDYVEQGFAKGYSIDYIQLVARSVGLEVEFISDTWKNILTKLDSKELDIVQLAAKNSDREKKYIFSDKIFNMHYSIVTKAKDSYLKKIDDFKNKKFALVEGWSINSLIKKTYKDIDFLKFKSSQETLEAVAFGLADGTIEDFYTAQAFINDKMLSNLEISSQINNLDNNITDLFIMADKENAMLIEILNKAIKQTDKSEIIKLKAKWIQNINETKKKNNIALTLAEKRYLSNKKVISMCIDPNWMPLEKNDNGKHIGMSSDYHKLLSKEIGIPIEMVETKTWLESMRFAKQRKCDIYSLAMSTPERKLYMDFTKPYLKIPLVLVTNNNEIFFPDVSKIEGKSIGIAKGYAYGEILRVKYPNLNLVTVENLQEGLELVEKNKLFGFIGTLATIGYNIQKNYIGQLKIAGKFEESWELGVGTRNDEKLLHSIFEKAIASIDESKHQEILNKWISVNYEKVINYSFLWKVIIFIAVVVMFLIYRQYTLKIYNNKLKVLSTTDSLTRLFNRMKLDEILKYEKSNFDRYEKVFSVILLDIDNFKEVNDHFGHHTGDKFLIELSILLKENMRSTDSIGRWGGEEFLVILPQADLEGAHKFAQKLKEKIENHHFDTVGHKTASFGVAQINSEESVEMLFERVDQALYTSKKNGKNRVTIDL